MGRNNIGRLIFFAVLALLLLAEFFFSNVGSLGRLETVAAQLGLTPEAERSRLFILIILDSMYCRTARQSLLSKSGVASNCFWFCPLWTLSNHFSTNTA
jgi:hypothetical protein